MSADVESDPPVAVPVLEWRMESVEKRIEALERKWNTVLVLLFGNLVAVFTLIIRGVR